ncbi:MAG: LysE family translocator [Planktomarina sp.]
MDPFLFISFLAATALIVGTPGPACALATTQAVRHGPMAAVHSIAGDALGNFTHITIAVVGLNLLISVAEAILPYLQIGGGLFLFYLAYEAFTAKHEDETPVAARRNAFLSGFFSCVTNPKAIVFFVALFPGFMSPDHSTLYQAVVYGAIFMVLDAISIFAYAMLGMYTFNKAVSPRINIDKVAGIGLFGVGSVLVYKGIKALPH